MRGANWFDPEIVQALGWTLLHFLWQGAGLALLLYIFAAFSISPRTRYAAALATLILMAASPVATFAFLTRHGAATEIPAIQQIARGVQAVVGEPGAFAPLSPVTQGTSAGWLGRCVGAWLIGVFVFTARAAGGWIVIERLRRDRIQPLAENLRARCDALQRRLGIRRHIGYVQSILVDSPAVVGWFRPLVLLPAAALTGLAPQQLEAVILHELAHIKRLDAFVNLFQVLVETVLFYHPAVWWVSRSIRAERENCCDDIAVIACGNAGEYARALALLESWRATPKLSMAATGGSLKARIARLIGFETLSTGVSRAGLAVLALLLATGALLAASGFHAPFFDQPDSGASPAPLQSSPPNPPVARRKPHGWPRALAAAPPPTEKDEVAEAKPAPQAPEPPPLAETRASGSYIEDLRALGYTNLTVDELIALKVQDVTPDYVRQLRDLGVHPSIHELIAMKVQGISADYVRQMRDLGLETGIHQLLAMKVQGISPEYVREMRALGFNAGTGQFIAMKIQGISPEYARELRSAGLNPTVEELISLKVQGVTQEYVDALRSAGLANLSTNQYIEAKTQGITPEFIQTVRSHGITNLRLDQLVRLKNAGIF